MSHFKIFHSVVSFEVTLLKVRLQCLEKIFALNLTAFEHFIQVSPHMPHVEWTRIIIKIGVLNCVMLPKTNLSALVRDEADNSGQKRHQVED